MARRPFIYCYCFSSMCKSINCLENYLAIPALCLTFEIEPNYADALSYIYGKKQIIILNFQDLFLTMVLIEDMSTIEHQKIEEDANLSTLEDADRPSVTEIS